MNNVCFLLNVKKETNRDYMLMKKCVKKESNKTICSRHKETIFFYLNEIRWAK